MKKVLIVSYHAPPRNVTAAHRIEGLIWNLPKFGWQPLVCSGPPLNSKLHKVLHLDSQQNISAQLAQLKQKWGIYSESSLLDKLATFYAEVFCYPDPMRGWADTTAAQEDFDRYHPDVVMSHSFPHTSHLVAEKLKRNGVPWVASFSDLWTYSHYYPYSRLRQRYERTFEHEVLKSAKCMITTTPTLAETLQKAYWQHVHMIPNGYPECEDVPLTKEFTMTYTGNFYAQRYDLEIFVWTLSMYHHCFPGLVVRFYGQPYPYLVEMVKRYKLEDYVKFMGLVSHHEALKAQKESHVLLMFAWNGQEQGLYQAKLLEYLGAKRPIIAFGGKDAMVGDLLEQTCTGAWCQYPEQFKLVMGHLYRQYEEKGAPNYHGDMAEVSKYSQLEMARKHAELFDRLA